MTRPAVYSSQELLVASDKGVLYLVSTDLKSCHQFAACGSPIFSRPLVLNHFACVGCRNDHLLVFSFQ